MEVEMSSKHKEFSISAAHMVRRPPTTTTTSSEQPWERQQRLRLEPNDSAAVAGLCLGLEAQRRHGEGRHETWTTPLVPSITTLVSSHLCTQS